MKKRRRKRRKMGIVEALGMLSECTSLSLFTNVLGGPFDENVLLDDEALARFRSRSFESVTALE